MRYILSFTKFWHNFTIGDDWTIAASIASAVAGTFWRVSLWRDA